MSSGETRPEEGLLPIGFRVGDYEVKEKIASGGFGSVYRVEHGTTGASYALKVLHAELAGTTAAERFQLEVDVVKRLHHPNMVQILDSGRLPDGPPYFVMELLIGVDLDTHVRSKGRLPPSDMLSILEAICSALSLAHESGILHRDVKASNVFLSARDGKRRVVLLDFGVAKLMDDESSGLTSMNRVVGTPFCMAPEQILRQSLDARTDVYALGALSYYMLTGELPFHDSNIAILQHMQLSIQPRKPSAVAPVGNTFDEVILRALSKRPEERPSSVNEFLGEFRAVAEGTTVEGSKQYERRMVAIHIQVQADSEAMEDGDDDLYTDMEKCLPFARRILTAEGFIPAGITGNSMTLVKELPPEADREGTARRRAVRTAMALERQLATRPTFDDRVKIDLCVHVGAVQVAGGKLVDGELLQASAWMPKGTWKGVVISASTLADLGLLTQAVPGMDGFFKVIEGGGQAPLSSR